MSRQTASERSLFKLHNYTTSVVFKANQQLNAPGRGATNGRKLGTAGRWIQPDMINWMHIWYEHKSEARQWSRPNTISKEQAVYSDAFYKAAHAWGCSEVDALRVWSVSDFNTPVLALGYKARCGSGVQASNTTHGTASGKKNMYIQIQRFQPNTRKCSASEEESMGLWKQLYTNLKLQFYQHGDLIKH